MGEIDTRAPFQSVKAAVSLFGEVVSRENRAIKKEKLSSEEQRENSYFNVGAHLLLKAVGEPLELKQLFQNAVDNIYQNVVDKETQLLLAQKEIDRIKRQLESAENRKARALSELEKAKGIQQDLTTKLKTITESKQSAIQASDALRNQTKKLEVSKSVKAMGSESWKQEFHHARKEYMTTVTELDATKQELNKIRQHFDAALDGKLAAFQHAAEAQRSANINTEKVSELSKDIAAMQLSIQHLNVATLQAQQEHAKIVEEKDSCLQSYNTAKQEAEKKLLSLKREVDNEIIRNLEVKFEETSAEIKIIQEEMKKVHASEMNAVRVVTWELNVATKTLEEVVNEEISLRSLVNSLRLELKDVKLKQALLKEKEMATQSAFVKLNAQLQDSDGEAELKPALVECKDLNASDMWNMKLQKLLLEAKNAEQEAEEMKRNANELKQEAEANRIKAKKDKKKLELALREAEVAKISERRALYDMNILFGRQDGYGLKSEYHARIKLSLEKFESLSRKVEETENLAKKKEEATLAQLEEINARKNEADKKLKVNLKAIEDIEAATRRALRKADLSESARTVAEYER